MNRFARGVATTLMITSLVAANPDSRNFLMRQLPLTGKDSIALIGQRTVPILPSGSAAGTASQTSATRTKASAKHESQKPEIAEANAGLMLVGLAAGAITVAAGVIYGTFKAGQYALHKAKAEFKEGHTLAGVAIIASYLLLTPMGWLTDFAAIMGLGWLIEGATKLYYKLFRKGEKPPNREYYSRDLGAGPGPPPAPWDEYPWNGRYNHPYY